MKENDKTSHRAELMRDIVAMVNQNPVLKQAWQRKKEKSIQNTEFEYPEHLSVEHIDMGLFKMEYLTWNGSENPYVILQLHGGGYMSGLQGQYRKMAGLYAEISSGAAVLSVDYRLAPEYPFPAALEDAVAAYKWLRDKGYESDRIIVVGDSAGGGLAMALCMELRTNGESRDLLRCRRGRIWRSRENRTRRIGRSIRSLVQMAVERCCCTALISGKMMRRTL